jgi:hypothetical protein
MVGRTLLTAHPKSRSFTDTLTGGTVARLLGPDPTARAVWRLVGGTFKSAIGAVVTVYTDTQGSTLADIRTYDPSNPSVVGAVIPGSRLAVASDSMYPQFWFPDGTDTLYVSADGSELQEINAAVDARLDALGTSISGAVTSVAGLTGAVTTSGLNTAGMETTAGAATKAGNAQSAAVTSAATDATTKANGAQAAAIAAAATDATTKANTAQANAIAAVTLATTATKNGSYSATANQLVPCDASAGTFTVTLPSASISSQTVVVKKIDSSTNAVTVQRSGNDTINSAGTSASLTLAGEAFTFTSNGLGMWTISAGQKTLSSLDGRYGRYELARAVSPAAGPLSSLFRGLTTVIQVVSDSTALASTPGGATGWPTLLGQQIGTAFPNYNVLVRPWNLTNQWYDPPVSLQSGPSGDSRITTSGSSMAVYAGSNVATDLDVRLRLKPNSWASGGLQVMACKWDSVGNQRSWWFGVTSTGLLCLTWTTDGTSGTQIQKFSTVVNGLTNGSTTWIRATLDVDNGSSGNTLTFYTSTNGTSWTQLGATVTTAGTTNIFSGTASYQLTSLDSTAGSTYAGDTYWVEVRDGIAGISLVPPLPDTWDQASLSTSNTLLVGGSPTVLVVNGSEGGQNIAYWDNATRRPKLLSPHAQSLIILSSTINEAYFTNGAWITTLSGWTTNAQALLPGVPICVLTESPAKSPVVQNEIDVRARRGVALMAWARSQAGVLGLDTYPAFTDITNQISSDGTHPTTAGQTVWRDFLFRALLQAG